MGYFYKKLKIPNGNDNEVLKRASGGTIETAGIDADEVVDQASLLEVSEKVDILQEDCTGFDERITALEETTDDIAERLHNING